MTPRASAIGHQPEPDPRPPLPAQEDDILAALHRLETAATLLDYEVRTSLPLIQRLAEDYPPAAGLLASLLAANACALAAEAGRVLRELRAAG
jgi:hypothetical protein